MDIQRLLAGDVHPAAGSHAHRFKASLCAPHEFRDKPQHHQAGDFFDGDIVQQAIIQFGVRRDDKSAAFAWAVAERQHHRIEVPGFLVGLHV